MKSIILYPDGSSYEGVGPYTPDCGACEPLVVKGEIIHHHPGGMHCACHAAEPA